jgi:hypothetical protein
MSTQHELALQALAAFVTCHTTLTCLARHVNPDCLHTIRQIQHDLLFDPALNFIKLGEQLDLDILTPLTRIFQGVRRLS